MIGSWDRIGFVKGNIDPFERAPVPAPPYVPPPTVAGPIRSIAPPTVGMNIVNAVINTVHSFLPGAPVIMPPRIDTVINRVTNILPTLTGKPVVPAGDTVLSLAQRTLTGMNISLKTSIERIAASGGIAGMKYQGITPALNVDQSAIASKLTAGDIAPNDPTAIASGVAAELRYKSGVTFSPFRFTVWNRKTGGLVDSSMASGGVNDMELVIGRWYLEFDAPASDKFLGIDSAVDIVVAGKKVQIEKARYDPPAAAGGKGTLKLQIKILENPLPLLGLIAIAAGAIGVGGWGLASSLKQVDKVIVDSTWIIVGGAAIALILFWPKLKRGFK